MAYEFDVVVVGSGPGGASAAREFTLAGKKVALLERGGDYKWVGSQFAVLQFADMSNALPIGHPIMVRAITTGGSTVMYCGTATRPIAWIKERTGIDLDSIADETEEELSIGPLPERLIGQGASRIMDAAQSLGMNWKLLPKFVNPDKCIPDCGMCMTGCKTEAKWTARQYIREACEKGMTLRTNINIDHVLRDNGNVKGVVGRGPEGEVEFRAPIVILGAGGLGTPVILKRSGIDKAGEGFFSDPLIFTYGVYNGKGSLYDVPMTAGTWDFHSSEGYLMTDLAEPWILMATSLGVKVPHKPKNYQVYKTLGIMTKCKDPVSGRIDRNGKLTKHFEPIVWERLNSGDRRAREILLKAGCDPKTVYTSIAKAAHPGGSARIGDVVDKNLETEIKGLYVADASVIPDELGTPVVLLAICLGKYAARNIMARGKV